MPSADPVPVALDYSDYLSWESKNRMRNPLKGLRQYFDTPGIVSFGGGYPHASTWPVNGMTLSVPFTGSSVFVPGYNNSTPDGLLPLAPYSTPLKSEPLRPDLSDELQYAAGFGIKHYTAWLTEHIQRVHKPPYEKWQVHATAGNTDGVDAIFRTCLDKGDYILLEEFAYPGTIAAAVSIGITPLGMPMDDDGVSAVTLNETLENWDEVERGAPRPKLFLLVPTCSNPSGSTMPRYRKQEIYAVCRRWGVIIVEDDPYYFLQIRPNGKETALVPSFLSLDVDGRVLRVDSFSKIVAPGSRAGWITGPAPLVEKIMNGRESVTLSPSGFAVAAITAVLRAWGSHEGFENNYLPHISSVYSKRCLNLISLLNKHLPEGTVTLPAPSGGMFLWVRLAIDTHPAYSRSTPEEISESIFQTMIEEGVLVVPSSYFKCPGGPDWSKEEEAQRIFFRLSFSYPTEEQMEEGARRFGRALRKQWGIEQ